jgi:hypothetical protein
VLGVGVEMRPYGKSWLLEFDQVQEELKVTPEQKGRMKEAKQEVSRITERMRVESKQALQFREEGNLEALNAFSQRRAAEQLRLTMETDEPLVKVLDHRQRTRLEQIQIQGEGPIVFRRPEIQRRLNLSPDQIEAIAAILVQGNEAMQQAATVQVELPHLGTTTPDQRKTMRESLFESKSFRPQLEKARKSVLGARQMTMRAIGKVLTRRQRENFEKMLGEPFDIARLRPEGAPPAKESKPQPSIEK